MVNCHIKKYLIIFFVLVQGAVAFSCASDDEVLEVVDLSVNKEVVDFKSEAGTQNITVSTNAPTWEAKADKNWCTPVSYTHLVPKSHISPWERQAWSRDVVCRH